jgi:hypothetical protein
MKLLKIPKGSPKALACLASLVKLSLRYFPGLKVGGKGEVEWVLVSLTIIVHW